MRYGFRKRTAAVAVFHAARVFAKSTSKPSSTGRSFAGPAVAWAGAEGTDAETSPTARSGRHRHYYYYYYYYYILTKLLLHPFCVIS